MESLPPIEGRPSSTCIFRAPSSAPRGLPHEGGLARHALEILLIGVAHALVAAARGHDLRRSLHDGIGRAVVGAPRSDAGIVTEGHDAGRVGVAVDREFLHRDLCFGALRTAAEGHEHRRAADRRVEHLDEAALREHVVVVQIGGEALSEVRAGERACEGIARLHGADRRGGVVLGTGAVDEFAGEVDHLDALVIHPHAGRIGHLGDLHDLDVLLAAASHERRDVLRLDHHGHALLRLADGQLRRVQTAVLRRHAVEVDVQTVGQLADRHAHAARTEVVRLLDEARHLRAAEQALQLALLGGIALLHLAAAGLQRLGVVLLRRTRSAADAVAARAAAEQQDPVARLGTFAADMLRLHGTHHGTHLEALGHVAFVVDLADVRRRQTDLVAVARIPRRGLLRDDALRQFARKRLGHGLPDVARTRHAHRLIDVAAARQRVADRTAQTRSRRSSEGLRSPSDGCAFRF